MASMKEHYANVPRAVVLHQMAVGECLEARLFWAMILWSWCGPQVSGDGAVVQKDAYGFRINDKHGEPIPATQKDLRELLGLPEGMKGDVSRAVRELHLKKCIRIEEKSPFRPGVMYPEREPTPQSNTESGCEYSQPATKWNIAGLCVFTTSLPDEQTARNAAVARLEELSTGWKADLQVVRNRYRELVRQAISGAGIIIEISSSRRLEEEEDSSSSLGTTQDSTTTTFSHQSTGNGTATAKAPEPDDGDPLQKAFKAAGKPVPNAKQCADTAKMLGNQYPWFMAWLSPRKLAPIDHPGALPSLISEFLAWKKTTVTSPPGAKGADACPKCGFLSMEFGNRCSNCHKTRAEAREDALVATGEN